MKAEIAPTSREQSVDSSNLSLSVRVSRLYDWLFNDALHDNITDDFRQQLLEEAEMLFRLTDIGDAPCPDISDNDLLSFCEVYAEFEVKALALARWANMTRIPLKLHLSTND